MFRYNYMEDLPFELLKTVVQYHKYVFPTDLDLISTDYTSLLEFTINTNRPGQLRSLLSIHSRQSINSKFVEWTAKRGHYECLRLLVEFRYPMDKYAIESAAYNGHVECLRLLILAGCPMDESATFWAVQNKHIECLRLLVDNNCQISTSAVQCAAGSGQIEYLRLLINANSTCIMLPIIENNCPIDANI